MKYCPNCGKKYQDSDKFCNVDGSRLVHVSSQSVSAGPQSRKKAVYAFIILAFIMLLGVNMIPFALKWAASNCKVSLQGIAIRGSDNVYQDIKEIFEEIRQIFSSGKIPDPNDQDITLILAIKNNNIFPFSLKSVNIRLYVNNRQAATGWLPSDQKIEIKAREKVEVRLPLDISLRVIPTILLDNEIRCHAKGKVLIDTFIGEMEYPIKIDGLNLPVITSEIKLMFINKTGDIT